MATESRTNGRALVLARHDDHSPEPWDRLPGEPDRAWEAFTIYRDLAAGRSYARVRKEYGRKPSYDRQIERWAARFAWQDRVFAWDVEQDRRARARMEQRKIQMELRHEEIGRAGAEAVLARLRGGKYELADGTEVDVDALDPNTLDSSKLVALLQAAVRTERLAHNQPVELTRGVFMLAPADVARMIESVIDVVYDFWGGDPRFGLFIERVRSIPTAR